MVTKLIANISSIGYNVVIRNETKYREEMS